MSLQIVSVGILVLQVLDKTRKLFVSPHRQIEQYKCIILKVKYNLPGININKNRMIGKVVGYSGFQTYGQLAYPARKSGKELQVQNKVWADTHREADQSKPLQNFIPGKTNYKGAYLETTKPADYHPNLVKKGQHKTYNFGDASIKAYETMEAQRYGELKQVNQDRAQSRGSKAVQLAKRTLLNSGVQHWKSNYQAGNEPRNQHRNLNMTSSLVRGITNDRWKQTTRQSKLGATQPVNQGSQSNWRSQSLASKRYNEEMSKAASWKHRAYLNPTKLGSSEYKFNYGENLGSAPSDLMNGLSYKQPIRDNPLKYGTNQLWSQVPNYQGFKPSALSFKEYKERINERRQLNRGDKKVNLLQNYHIQTPGYAGYKPKFTSNTSRLRESCFGKAGQNLPNQ